MIGYIRGRIIDRGQDQILLLAGPLGYEILLDAITIDRVCAQGDIKDEVELFIYYHVTERQPKPVLIGFLSPEDKAFFQMFITVSAIGPMKAIKALDQPVSKVAQAIENKDVAFLSKLNGIGKRTAEKIIATLNGKVAAFVGSCESVSEVVPQKEEDPGAEHSMIAQQVAEVLTEQLGHSTSSAKRMIREAFERRPEISTPEDLFDEIYRENR